MRDVRNYKNYEKERNTIMKKNMRKVINAVAAMLIGVSAFTGCSNKEETQKKETIQKNNQKQEVSEHKKKETNREQNEIKKEEMEDAVNLDDNQKDQEMHAENEQTQKSDIITNEKAVKKDGNHKQNDKNKQKDSLKNNSQIIQTEEKKETPDQTEIHKLLDTVKKMCIRDRNRGIPSDAYKEGNGKFAEAGY